MTSRTQMRHQGHESRKSVAGGRHDHVGEEGSGDQRHGGRQAQERSK